MAKCLLLLMNLLILYDLLLLSVLHFVRTWNGVGGNGIFVFISQMNMFRSYIYIHNLLLLPVLHFTRTWSGVGGNGIHK